MVNKGSSFLIKEVSLVAVFGCHATLPQKKRGSVAWHPWNGCELLIPNISEENKAIKASSTSIRKFLKTQIFFYEYGLRPHLSSVFSGLIRKFLKTLSRVEIFLSDTNTYACGRSYPEIFEYAFVILLDPVFTASIINKHGVQQGCCFFVSCSDF